MLIVSQKFVTVAQLRTMVHTGDDRPVHPAEGLLAHNPRSQLFHHMKSPRPSTSPDVVRRKCNETVKSIG